MSLSDRMSRISEERRDGDRTAGSASANPDRVEASRSSFFDLMHLSISVWLIPTAMLGKFESMMQLHPAPPNPNNSKRSGCSPGLRLKVVCRAHIVSLKGEGTYLGFPSKALTQTDSLRCPFTRIKYESDDSLIEGSLASRRWAFGADRSH